jgi:predicted ribosome quality control (RQC) complex YloA/Tae2 family protein
VIGAATLEDLAQVRGGPASSRPKTGRRPGPRRPYHRYTSTTGRPILVGRSGKDNHALTFQVARGSDLWLHTRDAPGAHVVVPLDKNEECDPQTLMDAAMLAAHGSPLKNDTRVEVTYTLAKNVHPIKGAPPGLVSVARGKTILVRVEPDRLRKLLDSKET